MVRWVRHCCMWASKAGWIGVAFVGGEVEAGLVRYGVDGAGVVEERVGLLLSSLRRLRSPGIGCIRLATGRPGLAGRGFCEGGLEVVMIQSGVHGDGVVDKRFAVLISVPRRPRLPRIGRFGRGIRPSNGRPSSAPWR